MDQVYSVARYLARTRSDADDLVQERFLRACRFWHQFQSGSNCKAWLAAFEVRPNAALGFEFTRHNVPVEEILSGGPRKDGIPALRAPRVVAAGNVSLLHPADRVVGVVAGGVGGHDLGRLATEAPRRAPTPVPGAIDTGALSGVC